MSTRCCFFADATSAWSLLCPVVVPHCVQHITLRVGFYLTWDFWRAHRIFQACSEISASVTFSHHLDHFYFILKAEQQKCSLQTKLEIHLLWPAASFSGSALQTLCARSLFLVADRSAVLCVVGCLAASLASTHFMPTRW
jgi:hypothetical protein